MTEIGIKGVSAVVIRRDLITSGSVGVNQCRFRFTSEWDALDKTVVFRSGEVSVEILLGESCLCDIPWEVLETPKSRLFAGVRGTRGEEIILPTVWADLGYVLEGVTPGGEAANPPTDVYAQILQVAREAEAVARSVREDADTGRFRGEDGAQGPQGIQGPKGDKGDPGADGVVPEVETGLRHSSDDSGYYFKIKYQNGVEQSVWWNDGKDGAQGPQGEKGDKGDPGEDGAQGPQGIQGPKGDKGDSPTTEELNALIGQHIPGLQIPAYADTEAKRVAEAVNAKRTANSVVFIAASDFHASADTSNTAAGIVNTRASCLDTGYGFLALQKYLTLDFAALLGDITYGPGNYTCAKIKSDMLYVKTAVSEGLRGLPQMWLRGNHDINYGKGRDRRMTENELYTYLGSHCSGMTTDPDNVGRNYGYYDIAAQRIRAIYLNTTDTLDTPEPATTENCPTGFFSPAQLNFLVKALKLSDKTDADEWGILLMSHYPIEWIGEGTKVLKILEGYKNGTSGSVSVTVNGTASTISYNFTSGSRGEIIASIHGHTHNFAYGKSSSGSSVTPWLNRIAVPQVMADRYNESATNSDATWAAEWGEFDSSGNPVYHNKVMNSAKSTSFNVFVIDRDAKVIHAIAYGAGVDRSISYGGAVLETYTVTNSLTNVTSSNAASSALENSSYTATLTASSGYQISSVVVKMGGVDITSTAYSNGTITISSVTGNIVITAAAVVIPVSYTNQIPISQSATSTGVFNGTGYMDGKYLSSGGSGESSDSAFFATGFIPYRVGKNIVPKTIYVKGADWTAVSHCRMGFYKSGKAIDRTIAGNSSTIGTAGTYFKVTVLDAASKYWKLEPVMYSATASAYYNMYGTEIEYIRFSLAGTGAGVVVTIDEEI